MFQSHQATPAAASKRSNRRAAQRRSVGNLSQNMQHAWTPSGCHRTPAAGARFAGSRTSGRLSRVRNGMVDRPASTTRLGCERRQGGRSHSMETSPASLVWVTGSPGVGKSTACTLPKARHELAVDADWEGYNHWVDRVTGHVVAEPPYPAPAGRLEHFAWRISRSGVEALVEQGQDRTTFRFGSVVNRPGSGVHRPAPTHASKAPRSAGVRSLAERRLRHARDAVLARLPSFASKSSSRSAAWAARPHAAAPPPFGCPECGHCHHGRTSTRPRRLVEPRRRDQPRRPIPEPRLTDVLKTRPLGPRRPRRRQAHRCQPIRARQVGHLARVYPEAPQIPEATLGGEARPTPPERDTTQPTPSLANRPGTRTPRPPHLAANGHRTGVVAAPTGRHQQGYAATRTRSPGSARRW